MVYLYLWLRLYLCLTTLLDECRMRWTGVYVVLHTDDKPSHLGIFGYSGD
ncbi:hypothetical protein [Streptomyces sp. NPDC002666]